MTRREKVDAMVQEYQLKHPRLTYRQCLLRLLDDEYRGKITMYNVRDEKTMRRRRRGK